MCNRFLNFSSFPSPKLHFLSLLSVFFLSGAGIARAESGEDVQAAPMPEDKKAKELAAVAAAKAAVITSPQSSQSHLALAIAYGQLARQEAPRRQIELSKLIKEEAEEAVHLDPKNGVAWYVLARWNSEMASVNPFLRGLAQMIYGRFPDASTARAEECFRKAIAAGPPRVTHHIEYGLMLVTLDRKNDARKQLETGLSIPAKDKEDEETQQRARQALDRLR